MTEKTFSEVKMLKRNQVTTMNILRRGITIEGETQKIDHRLLTQRMLVLLALDRDSPNLADNFEYELAAVPMSLFDPSTGMMRKPDKASFAKSLDTKVSDRAFVKPKDTHYVLDGGALLQIIPWQHLETYADILKSYSFYITKHYGNATVVFDGYKSSTKDVEHGRRHKITSVDVAFDEKSPVLVNKTNFLANINNKQLFIDMLSRYLSQKGHKVLQAEADADILIVKTALLISSQEHVTVVADDTDVFVMLLKHCQKDICLQSAVQCNKLKDIPSFQEQLGKDACSILPFVHSLTGCDTTSSLFGRNKSVALKKILNSPVLFSYASAFGTKGLSVDALIGMGTKLLVELYGGKSDKHSLNQLRYELYIQKTSTARKEFDIVRLPPTENAAYYHLLRVQLQCYVWDNLEADDLNPLEWGWRNTDGSMVPLPTCNKPAPPELQAAIMCSCKTDNEQACGKRCSCRKYGLACSVACKNCNGRDCSNSSLDSTLFESDIDD